MGKEHEILQAAQTGNLGKLEALLTQKSKVFGLFKGPNINWRDDSGYTALHLAALNGQKDVVCFLLHNDASANIPDNAGSFPLHLAAFNGHDEVASLLITRGPSRASVNEPNLAGDTALHVASQYGHTKVVKVLLECHADLHLRNAKEESALDLAAMYGRFSTVQLILLYDRTVFFDAIHKHSPLHFAARNGHEKVVELLLSNGMPVNATCDMGTALHCAALYGKFGVSKFLLQKGIDIEIENNEGQKVLDLLCDHPSQVSQEITALIYEQTQNRHEKDKSKVFTTSASYSGQKYLLVNNAQKNSTTEISNTKQNKLVPNYDLVPPPRPAPPKVDRPYSVIHAQEIKSDDRFFLKRNFERASISPILNKSISMNNIEKEEPLSDYCLLGKNLNEQTSSSQYQVKATDNVKYDDTRENVYCILSSNEKEAILVKSQQDDQDNQHTFYKVDNKEEAPGYKETTAGLPDSKNTHPTKPKHVKQQRTKKINYDINDAFTEDSTLPYETFDIDCSPQNLSQSKANEVTKNDTIEQYSDMKDQRSSFGQQSKVKQFRTSKANSLNEIYEWNKIDKCFSNLEAYIDMSTITVKPISEVSVESIFSWLASMSFSQYEPMFIANGFDEIEFLNGCIDEQDLLEIGILDSNHRKMLMEAIGNLPKVLEIGDEKFPIPKNVGELLGRLKLSEYERKFVRYGYENIDRVRVIWDIELLTVLNMTPLGHRKRILSSLGRRNISNNKSTTSWAQKFADAGLKKENVPLFGEESKMSNIRKNDSDLHEVKKVNLTDVKNSLPVESKSKITGESEVKHQYAKTFVESKSETTEESEVRHQNVETSEEPSHLNETKSKQLNRVSSDDKEKYSKFCSKKNWLHDPDVLLMGSVSFLIHYLGSHPVQHVKGVTSTLEACAKMKTISRNITKMPLILLSISARGIDYIDSNSKLIISQYVISHISFCAQDPDDMSVFAYITRDEHTMQSYCHVFRAETTEIADKVVVTIGQCFELAYEQHLHMQQIKWTNSGV
ncbi:ankyrin repeat and sterile alpha motif domain-containing protein 1B isoform X4 [Hydra vulgaris]|uniref:Ankyrin repeat and sterile alpha motif domain-containing protein 1B isoform X4 n=1 Tax=Hydra vulgaris TaxID=6087 RepID=A0ABM4BCJ2_HYDVU